MRRFKQQEAKLSLG